MNFSQPPAQSEYTYTWSETEKVVGTNIYLHLGQNELSLYDTENLLNAYLSNYKLPYR